VTSLALLGTGEEGESIRLVYLCDSATRSLFVFQTAGDTGDFVFEFSCDVPVSSHFLLPLRHATHLRVAVINRHGIVRINTGRGQPVIPKELPVFMPQDGLILTGCHFGGDLYLMGESGGGLLVSSFPSRGLARTQCLGNIEPVCALVKLDDSHFAVASPFGDLVVFNWSLGEPLREWARIAAAAPVVGIEPLLYQTGRGDTAAHRSIDRVRTCKLIARVPLRHCFSLFSLVCDEILYLCLSFSAETHIVKFDGKQFSRV
jgi:hypothetical protein